MNFHTHTGKWLKMYPKKNAMVEEENPKEIPFQKLFLQTLTDVFLVFCKLFEIK